MTPKRRLFDIKMGLLKRGSAAFARELEANERLSPDELAALNRKRRRELVRYAFSEIPFYRRKYSRAGFEPGDLEDQDCFGHLPILQKKEIRRCAEEILAPGCRFDELVATSTGGTTGEPLRTYRDAQLPLSVLSWRTLRWWGLEISDSSGYLYRAVPEGWRRAAQRVALWPTRRNWLSASAMTAERMARFCRALQRDRAVYLVGYVGAIEAFADHLVRGDQRIDSLEAVWTTSSPLPAGQRRFLERVFGCPVFIQYGSCEFYWVAAECRRQAGLHVASDVRHVEAVDGERPVAEGEWGDLVITDLIDRKFPLIRYRVGDRGRVLDRPCSCRLPFPMMDYVKGRTADSIVTSSGALVPGEFWTTFFDEFPDHVRSYRVHQTEDLAITVEYEPHRGVDCSGVVSAVRDRMASKFGEEIAPTFVETRVEADPEGKQRYVVSDARR